jgi:hypothetical protein
VSTALATVAEAPFVSAAQALNLRQKSFVDNLLQVKIKWKAAELAGYSGDMYSLAVTANNLLNNPKVQAYYNECLESMACSPHEVLAEIGEIAKYSLDSIALEGSPVRTPDKLKALELAGKYHKLFTDRVETEVANPQAIAQQTISLLREAMLAARQAQVGQLSAGESGPDGPVVETTAIIGDTHE